MSAGKIIGWSALGVVVFLAVMVAGYAFQWFTVPFVGALEQRQITNKGQYRIQSYEQFYRWQEEVQSVEGKLQGYPAAGLDIRQSAECRGLLARRADIVSRYNAASRSVLTQGQWQAPELPQTLIQNSPRRCD